MTRQPPTFTRPGLIIGIDGGGTYTRVLVGDVTGQIHGASAAGGASPFKTADAKSNVQQAIRAAVADSGASLPDVACLVAGMAGLDSAKDLEWATEFTTLEGLGCPHLLVNDAVIAHAGAHQSQSGIIAIGGTGSIVFGVNEAGVQIRNYDFAHQPPTTARNLSFDAVHRILAGEYGDKDAILVSRILEFWNVGSVAELRTLGMSGFVPDYMERTRRFGEMAPLVTAAAGQGVPLARSVCDSYGAALVRSIRIIGNCFAGDEVPVALIGGAVNSPPVRDAVVRYLDACEDRRYPVITPALTPAAGAVLMGIREIGYPLGDDVVRRLGSSSLAPPDKNSGGRR